MDMKYSAKEYNEIRPEYGEEYSNPEYGPEYNTPEYNANDVNWEYLSPEFLYILLKRNCVGIFPFEYEKTMTHLLEILRIFFHVTTLDLHGFASEDLLVRFLQEFRTDTEKVPPFFFLLNANVKQLEIFAQEGHGCIAIQTSVSEESQLKGLQMPPALMWYNKKTHIFHPFLTIDMSDPLIKWIKGHLFRVKDLSAMKTYAQQFMVKMQEFLRIAVGFSIDAYRKAFHDWTPVEHATAKYVAETYYHLLPDIIPPQIDRILKDLDQTTPANSLIQEKIPESESPRQPKASKSRKKKETTTKMQSVSESSILESPKETHPPLPTEVPPSLPAQMTPEEISYMNEYSHFTTHPMICRAFNAAFSDFSDPRIEPSITSPEAKYVVARKTVFKDGVPLSFILQIYFPILSDRSRGKKQTITKVEAQKLAQTLWEEVVTALSPLATNLTFSEMDIVPILQTMTAEGIISDTQIEHYENIDQFEQEVNPPPPKASIIPFQEVVTAKIEQLKLEMPIYDPDLETKLATQVKTLMQQLNAVYLQLHRARQ